MKRGFRVLVPFAGAALALALAGPAFAIGTLDQEQTNTDDHTATWDTGFQIAQTFRADITGTLDTVSLYGNVYQYDSATPAPGVNVEVSIWPVDGATGYPDQSDDPLAFADVHFGGTQAWTDVVFEEAPQVVAHTYYAIVVQVASGHEVDWAGKCGTDLYEYGAAYVDGGENGWMTVHYWHDNFDVADWECQLDWAFRTYVTAEASSSAAPSAEASSAAPSTAASASASHAPTITPPPTSAGNATGGDRGLGIILIAIATIGFCGSTLIASSRQLKRR